MTGGAPIVLDLDGSVIAPPDAVVVAAREWEQRLRFACSRRTLAGFAGWLGPRLPQGHGTVLMGSGDFHHLTLPLLERRSGVDPFDVLVLDNHPDNMRFPFGVHCGSWVASAARLPGVRRVHVAGMTSADVSAAHAWENRLEPLRDGRVQYWCVSVDVRWAARRGITGVHGFDAVPAMCHALAEQLRRDALPVYLSIDKDVFAPEVVSTNWDQGLMQPADARALIEAVSGRIVGSDITGDVSVARYRNPLKRALAALDAQPEPDAAALPRWRQAQARLDHALLGWISAAARR